MLHEKEIFQRRIEELLIDWERIGARVHAYPWLIASDLEEGYCCNCSKELYVDSLVFLNVQDPAMAWCSSCVAKDFNKFKLVTLPEDEVHQLRTTDMERLLRHVIIFFEGHACR